MDPTLRSLLIARLEASELDADARSEILAVTGAEAVAPEGAPGAGEVYLRSVTVEGFRGIGPAATLELPAQPGLTVVVGRNGSGKSSFAEGLELLLTGTTKRWDAKTKNWAASWQCLHHAAPTRVSAELVVAGEDAPVALAQEWERGSAYDSPAGRDAVAATLAARGWDTGLASFRPFLAYAELASMFDKTTSLYAALSPILGLEDVDVVLRELSARRLERDNHAKLVKQERSALRSSMDDADERQAALAALLGATKPDLTAIKTHLDEHPHGTSATDASSAALRQIATRTIPADEDLSAAWQMLAKAEDELAAVTGENASAALATAALLAQALEIRSGEDCPVCGTPGVLDEAWADSASARVAALRAGAADLEHAARHRAAVASTWNGLADSLAALAEEPTGLARSLDQVLTLAGLARDSTAKARALLEAQDTVWRGRIEATLEWLARAKAVQVEAHGLQAMKAAEKWLKAEADVLRNERFAPIAEQAIANWELLKHESNVELHSIKLRSVGQNRRADFDVRADGAEADAFGVMSQGELLALAVSVFLPRAGLDESPFRFAVIDDPVQSMDPAKVDGLARVLALAAETRQVVVFTHDDRLPEAVRRLKISANVFQVHRRSLSRVSVDPSLTPVRRHLDDARALAKSTKVSPEVQLRVVPALCREAVEAACAEIVRGKAVKRAEPVATTDARLRDAQTLRKQLTLALFDDPDEHLQLNPALSKLQVGTLIDELNAGTHGEWTGDPLDLRTRTYEFVFRLMQSAA